MQDLFVLVSTFFRKHKVVSSVVFASIISIIAYSVQFPRLRSLNALVWIVVDYYLYRDVFKHVNSIDISDDLKFWGVRIVGLIVAVIGFSFGFIYYAAAGMSHYDPAYTAIAVLAFGLCALGVFMLFRTNRRFAHIYVNR